MKRSVAAAHELEYILLRDLGFLPEAAHDELRDELKEVRKMISGLLKRLAASPQSLR